MFKTKYLIIALVVIGLLASSALGYILWQKSVNNKITRTPNSIQGSDVLADTTSGEPTLLQMASGSNSYDLGPQSISSGNSNKPSTTSSSAPKQLDPTTFGQYDKYKDNKTTLFIELLPGTGPEIVANKKAAVFYKLWLTDGTLVDMTRPDEKGEMQPFVFTPGAHQVIQGWEEGLAGMKVGGVRLLIVPPALGYGSTAKENIPVNSVLIFQVQLAAVE